MLLHPALSPAITTDLGEKLDLLYLVFGQHVALSKAPVAALGKGRTIRHSTFQPELAKPPIG